MSGPLEVRDDLATLVPYVSPQRPARVRLNTNESPYPPPRDVMAQALAAIEGEQLNRYPAGDADELYEALAAHTGIAAERLWIANGSNEVFLHLMLAYGGPQRSVVVFEPSYPVHQLIARITGTRIIVVARDEKFGVQPDGAAAAIQAAGAELTIVCSPNNPTGNVTPVGVIEELVRASPGLVVVDEAYIEFAPAGSSLLEHLGSNERLVVTRTFSKAWRLAGARLGYLAAVPEVVSGLRKVRLPYHLSSATQVLGIALLEHAHRSLEHVADIVAERDKVIEGLRDLGLRVHPSDSNFVLFEVSDPDATWSALLERGVLVRNYSGLPELSNCLRVSVGLSDETDAFLGAMKEVLDG